MLSAGVAAVLLVTSGVAVAVTLTSGHPSSHTAIRPPDDQGTKTVSDPGALTAPPGTRLVGLNGVAVAVPASWGINQAVCQTPEANTAIVGLPHGGDCAYVPSRIWSSAALEPYDGTYWRLLKQSRPAPAIDGLPVARVATHGFRYSVPARTATLYEGALLFKTENVTVTVRSPNADLVDRILDSAFAIPSGYDAVPPDATPQSLARIGMVVSEQVRYRPRLVPGSLLETRPDVGSIVTHGSTVTLTHSTRVAGRPCAGLQVKLVTPAGARDVSVVARDSFTVRVPAGESVAVDAMGACAETVTASSDIPAVLRRDGGRQFTAVAHGRARLVIYMPECAGALPSANCRGGIFSFAEVTVVVEP